MVMTNQIKTGDMSMNLPTYVSDHTLGVLPELLERRLEGFRMEPTRPFQECLPELFDRAVLTLLLCIYAARF
jgi:hypothetical protein